MQSEQQYFCSGERVLYCVCCTWSFLDPLYANGVACQTTTQHDNFILLIIAGCLYNIWRCYNNSVHVTYSANYYYVISLFVSSNREFYHTASERLITCQLILNSKTNGLGYDLLLTIWGMPQLNYYWQSTTSLNSWFSVSNQLLLYCDRHPLKFILVKLWIRISKVIMILCRHWPEGHYSLIITLKSMCCIICTVLLK